MQRRRYTSVKPGRGPSFMGGLGSVTMIVFGIIWTAMAFQMTGGIGGPASLFPLFGILFTLCGVANAVYSFRNATAKNRYSMVDITDSDSEADPLNEIYAGSPGAAQAGSAEERYVAEEVSGGAGPNASDSAGTPHGRRKQFCPYCGMKVASHYRFCPDCGRELEE